MPVTTSWLMENRIILHQYLGIVTIQDLREAGEKSLQMLRANPDVTIYMLHDRREMKTFPYDLAGIRSAVLPTLREKNMGYQVGFGGYDPAIGFVSDLIAGLARLRFKQVATMEAALSFLTMLDPTLLFE